MTFAATAEVVRYLGAFPLLIDCEPETLNLDLSDAARKIARLKAGSIPGIPATAKVTGLMPVHVGGAMVDVKAIQAFAAERGLWVVEDAAHAFPAAWRPDPSAPWQRSGEGTAAISCFSFYANKTITTGEGGMATTDDAELAQRMRLMSLHGLSQDAWKRYAGGGLGLPNPRAGLQVQPDGRRRRDRDPSAGACGGHAARARGGRGSLYEGALRRRGARVPPARREPAFTRGTCSRSAFASTGWRSTATHSSRSSSGQGVGCSVHWRPLHLHPYYEETFGWKPEDFPHASQEWERLISLPIFPTMDEAEIDAVVERVSSLCAKHRSMASASASAAREGQGRI